MKKDETQLHNDAPHRDFYETGSTQPPKNHGGVLAVLLVLVIVLCGIVTILGITNIQLFRTLSTIREEQLVQWGDTHSTVGSEHATEQTAGEEVPVRLGLKCVTVSDFDRQYYLLPPGCLVMEVLAGTPAETGGIHIGDVIVSINGRSVDSAQELLSLLQNRNSGETVTLEIYRTYSKNNVTVTVTLE